MGRWSAQHRKTAIWGWLAFVIFAFVIGNAVGLRTADQAHLGVGESGRAELTVDNAFPKNADEMVLVQSASSSANNLGFRAAAGDAMFRLSQLPYVYAVESPYDPANQSQISADGHSALIRFKIAGDESTAKSRAGSTLRAVAETQAAHPQYTIGEFGDASSNNQVSASISSDFKTALVTSLPITLLILLVAFGALVAAACPCVGSDGGHRDDRPDRPDQPPRQRSGRVDQRGDPADRPRCRRRLLDVLFAPRARGARGRAKRGRLAGGRGRHLRSCRDGLGLHGDDRDGGHVPGRSTHVPVIRHRHDPRCRRGRGRLAHRPPGRARLAR